MKDYNTTTTTTIVAEFSSDVNRNAGNLCSQLVGHDDKRE